jgi:hypothetical protein
VGTNDYGQLGLGDYENRHIPELVEGLTPPRFELLEVVAGPEHVLVAVYDYKSMN